jgi:hypothetical protein
MRIEREPDYPTPYVDSFGRGWSAEKLDDLLGDPEVSITVQSGASIGLRPNRTWDRAAVRRWAEIRFTRWETGALVVVLIERWFETAGARYLRPEARV